MRKATRIDCVVHNDVPSLDALIPYLPDYWVEQIHKTRFTGAIDRDHAYPPGSELATISDARVDGGPPDLARVREQALDDGVELAILLCTYAVDSLHNPDHAIALASAVNDWQVAEWLDLEPRLRGSIVVPSQIPQLAADEIDRVASHPGFVQVALPVRSHQPYGSRLYLPLWEAIARHELVAGLFYGGAPGSPPTPVGWPSLVVEEFVAMAGVFAAQVTSLIAEGVFARFPELRVTLIESGASWLPSHLWRFDKEWKNLRYQVPWVRRPPSEYARDHIRLTIEPWDVPADEQRIDEILQHFESDEMLLDASSYPHLPVGRRDYFLSSISDERRSRVTCQNARAWYRV